MRKPKLKRNLIRNEIREGSWDLSPLNVGMTVNCIRKEMY